MRNRRVLLVVAVCLIAAVVITFWPRHENEPQAQGHPLSYWVNLEARESWRGGNPAAQQAISEIGGNAIAPLLNWIRYEARPHEFRESLLEFAPAARPLVSRLCEDKDEAKAENAIYAFRHLNSCAEQLVPRLIGILNDPAACTNQVFRRARLALRSLHSDAAIPLYAACLANTNSANRPVFAALMSSCPMTTNADLALDALLKCLSDQDSNVVLEASGVLMQPPIGKLSVPALTNVLAYASDDVLRCRIVSVLGQIALTEEIARPAVLQALGDSRPSLRLQATNAIQKWAAPPQQPPPLRRVPGLWAP